MRFVLNSQTGEVKLKMNHDEFGQVLVDSNPNYLPFGFAGGIYDSETKLVRFGVRDYEPRIGRWTSKDPIRFKGGDENLYGYVVQNPINWVDSNGNYATLPGSGANDPGYFDVNFTIGFGPVITGGVQVGSGSTCFYVGGGAGTPGLGVSYQPGAPSYSDSVCGSISNGISIGGSVGSETSPSVGISGPGLSLTYQRTLVCF